LADAPDDAQAMREEPRGSPALLSPVHTLDEAIEKANSLPYGLAASVFTHSAREMSTGWRTHRGGQFVDQPSDRLICQNPVRWRQGERYGREGGAKGLECYTVARNVSHLVL
jgi:succinate-semialdehyde dehydrogenase / glutarate-semialdehyde dehydrogenase